MLLIRLCMVAVLFPIVLAAQPVAAAPPKPDEIKTVMTHVIDDVVRPGYADFAEQAGRLNTAVTTLCAGPSGEALEEARGEFSKTVRQWGRIEMIRFGPIIEENRLERILFYPDPRGIGMRQVQAILAKKDASATSRESLANKSVATQGLGALEFVLFAKGSDALAGKDAGFHCRYAEAIAANVKTIARAVSDAWADPEGVARVWRNPGASEDVFYNPGEALTSVLSALMHGIENVNDVRIAAFFADTPSRDRPKRALFWRSNNTMPLIAADVQGMQALFDKGRMASVLAPEDRSIVGLIDYGFRSVIKQARAIDKPIGDALSDIPTRQKFIALRSTLANLKNRLGNEYGLSIGLSSGFSFADGD